MVDALYAIAGFLIAIFVLVLIHEWGHYIVARIFGIRVVRFSIGFGKPIWSYRAENGTWWILGRWPLGGYVEMLESKAAEHTANAARECFDARSPWVRLAVVLAGPLINLATAILFFAAASFGTQQALRATIGPLNDTTPLYAAGLRYGDDIQSVNGRDTETYQALLLAFTQEALAAPPNAAVPAELVIRRGDGQNRARLALSVDIPPDLLDEDFSYTDYGLVPWQPLIAAVLGEVVAESPAARAELLPGDAVMACANIEGGAYNIDTFNAEILPTESLSWQALVQCVRAAPNETVELVIVRGGEWFIQPVALDARIADGAMVGFLGASPEMPSEAAWEAGFTTTQYGVGAALAKGWHDFGQFFTLTKRAIAGFFTGRVPIEQMGGPATIADGAGSVLQRGLQPLLFFLGVLSISIALMNLLPIPVLDGGQALMFIYEIIFARQVPEKVVQALRMFGVGMVATLMLLAIYSDLLRFW